MHPQDLHTLRRAVQGHGDTARQPLAGGHLGTVDARQRPDEPFARRAEQKRYAERVERGKFIQN